MGRSSCAPSSIPSDRRRRATAAFATWRTDAGASPCTSVAAFAIAASVIRLRSDDFRGAREGVAKTALSFLQMSAAAAGADCVDGPKDSIAFFTQASKTAVMSRGTSSSSTPALSRFARALKGVKDVAISLNVSASMVRTAASAPERAAAVIAMAVETRFLAVVSR